ncbi:hypothetical protein [Streptomyces sp. NPDC002788]
MIARFPPPCLRADRASVPDHKGLDETTALDTGLRHGTGVLAESLESAARFPSGAGRHASFTELSAADPARVTARHVP